MFTQATEHMFSEGTPALTVQRGSLKCSYQTFAKQTVDSAQTLNGTADKVVLNDPSHTVNYTIFVW